jgi:hypothetical protein
MGDQTPSDPPQTRDEVEDLVADLFGDFNDDDEPDPASASSGTPRLASTAPAADESEGEPRKKRRKVDASKFFDTEAVEAGASGDEEEGEHDDIIDDSAPMDRQAQAAQKAELDRLQQEMDERHFSGSTVRSSNFLDDLEARAKAAHDESDEGISLDDIGKVVPSQVVRETGKNLTVTVPDAARDPRLWVIKTFAPERELVLSLLLKAGECSLNGKECPLYSAFYNPALRGYIYVEAHKENDIRTFSKGIRGISPWGIKLVPVGQMPQVFSAAVTDSERKEPLMKVIGFE